VRGLKGERGNGELFEKTPAAAALLGKEKGSEPSAQLHRNEGRTSFVEGV